MGSQPDYEQAYKFNPELRPVDTSALLEQEQKKNQILLDMIAKLTGKAPEEVTKDVASASIPVAEAPLQASDDEVAAEQTEATAEGALFFASKEGTKYYSIDQIGTVKMKQENIRYFKSEQEALDAQYISAA